jgi:hypothetical protein
VSAAIHCRVLYIRTNFTLSLLRFSHLRVQLFCVLAAAFAFFAFEWLDRESNENIMQNNGQLITLSVFAPRGRGGGHCAHYVLCE